MRILKRRTHGLKIDDIINSKSDLLYVKRFMFSIFKDMNLSINNLKNIKVRFGREIEFDNTCSFLNLYKNGRSEIVVKRGRTTCDLLGDLSHEYGHEVTILGKFGIIGHRRKNLIGEISAYNFEKQFLDKYNKKSGDSLIIADKDFLTCIRTSVTHYLSRNLMFIPLGSLICEKYKSR